MEALFTVTKTLKKHLWKNRFKYYSIPIVITLSTLNACAAGDNGSSATENPPPKFITPPSSITIRISNVDEVIDDYFQKRGNLGSWSNTVYWIGPSSTTIKNGVLTGTTRMRYEKWIRMIFKTRLFRKTVNASFSIEPESLIVGEGENRRIAFPVAHTMRSGNVLIQLANHINNNLFKIAFKIAISSPDGKGSALLGVIKDSLRGGSVTRSGKSVIEIAKISDLKKKGIECEKI